MLNKDNKQEKKKLKITIILLIIVVIMCSIGVTLALNKKSDVIVTTGIYNVIIEGDTTITPGSLVPIPNTSDTISYDNLSTYSDYIYVSSFTVKGAETNPTEHNIIYDVALINQNIDTNLLNQYLKWELIRNGEIISNGNFSNLTNGTRYVLTTIQEDLPRYEDSADSLQLVIWINDNFDLNFDQTTMMNKIFSSTIDIELYTDSKVKAYNITNLVVNGSFKNGLENWTNLGKYSVILDSNAYDGNNSLKLPHNNGEDLGMADSGITQVTSENRPILAHKYYGSIEFKSSNIFTVADSRFEWYRTDTGNCKLVFAYKAIQTSEWVRLSSIKELTNSDCLDLSGDWIIRNFVRSATDYSYIDSTILIDLTEAFGEGNEPSREWCDKNIEYFEGTITIYK
jgi:flagellar basal body-associated protein FliL